VYKDATTASGFIGGFTDYGMNVLLNTQSAWPATAYYFCSLGSIKDPTSKLLLGDGTYYRIDWTLVNVPVTRHPGGMVHIYVDGHAGWINRPTIPSISTHVFWGG
jgi:hypothetical protein